MIQKFIRQEPYRQLVGMGKSEWKEARKDGRISPPDGYLGPRSPFWTELTVERDQARLIGRGRPIETRPTRRRKAAQAEAAA
jgi:hypothetical protein